ncbi:FtsW/RodA/SpoVE family cell cycle protein, partial [Candidatus Uhrbacteria bacterium]|nr:FtsW/RodA/SpoVE family cell cycle protein [Candidatus Uhrbacteria bacterium]
MRLFRQSFTLFDWPLALSVFVLVLLGLSAQYGMTLSVGAEGVVSTFTKQIVALAVGLIVAIGFILWDGRRLQSYAGTLYAFAGVLLVAVLFFGVNRRGTTGWFDLGVVDVQPVELAKIAIVIAVAALLSRRRRRRVGWKEVLITGVPVWLYAGLVFLQPDFGSGALMLGVWGVLLLLAGIDRKVLLALLGVGALLALTGWFVFFEDFQRERIM